MNQQVERDVREYLDLHHLDPEARWRCSIPTLAHHQIEQFVILHDVSSARNAVQTPAPSVCPQVARETAIRDAARRSHMAAEQPRDDTYEGLVPSQVCIRMHGP